MTPPRRTAPHTAPTEPVIIRDDDEPTPDGPSDAVRTDPVEIVQPEPPAESASPQAAAVLAIERVPAAEAQHVPAVVGLGLVRGDGSSVTLDEVVGDTRTTTVMITENVYEKFILPGSNPLHPRVGKRLALRKGKSVPVSILEKMKARLDLVEAKERMAAAPENKGPGAIETK